MSRQLVSKNNGAIGTIVSSLLNLTQFQALNGLGWVLCEGQDISGSKYALQTGNNVAPDTRAVFFRGTGTKTIGSVNYTAASLGTYQNDTIQEHSHDLNDPMHAHTLVASGAGLDPGVTAQIGTITPATTQQSSTGITIGDSNNCRAGTETVPAHLVVNYFIKIN